jgi:putative FmdB family regulatory protein
MPTYDYECAACRRRFEVVHGVHAEGPTACPICGKGPVRKVITAANVHYKGSGWAKKERRSTATAAAKNASSGNGSSDDSSTTGVAASDTGDASGSSDGKSESGSSQSTAAASSKTRNKPDKPSKSGASTSSD